MWSSAANGPTGVQLFISHVIPPAQLPAAAYTAPAANLPLASLFASHPSLTSVGLSAVALASSNL